MKKCVVDWPLVHSKSMCTALCLSAAYSSGDAVVAFSKKDLYSVSRELEKRGIEAGLIYGGLPPDVKMKQAENFNDPDHPCNVLVATDAIGMGINLNIQRIIFHSMTKPTLLDNGNETRMRSLSHI